MLSQQQAQIMPLPSHLALLQHWFVALIRLFDEIVCVITLLLQLRQNRLQIRRRSLARRYLLLCLGYDASQLVQQLLLHVRYTFTCVLWHLVQAQHTLTAHRNLSTHSQQPRVAIWSDSRHCQSTTVQLHKKTINNHKLLKLLRRTLLVSMPIAEARCRMQIIRKGWGVAALHVWMSSQQINRSDLSSFRRWQYLWQRIS